MTLTQGITVYRLNHTTGEHGIVSINHAANNEFLAVIDNEVWSIRGDGQRELTGLQSEMGPFMVAGTRVNSLANLPDPVQRVIAARAEALQEIRDGQVSDETAEEKGHE